MTAAATRSCTELVQTLGSSGSSAPQQQAAAAALLALPMTPDTWIIMVGAIPALVRMLTQPAGKKQYEKSQRRLCDAYQALRMRTRA